MEMQSKEAEARNASTLCSTQKNCSSNLFVTHKNQFLSILSRFHAGYFRISLSLCSQALLWKTLSEPSDDIHKFRSIFRMLPSTAFILLWSLALFSLISLSFLYLLRLLFHFDMVKSEFLHHVGVNYLFAPWISCLVLLQATPFFKPKEIYFLVLWWIFVVPIVALDIKIYGQWITKGKRFLSGVANPTSQLSVIGNLVGARAAAEMGWNECALFLFAIGISHYLVLFVTLYQRLPGSSSLPAMLRPVFFLFLATPSMASLAWDSIYGKFDSSSKMLFFLSLFLFFSLVSRPALFKRSMRKFNVSWWAYSFPITVMAMASTKYAQEMKNTASHILMLLLSGLSVIVLLVLMIFTAFNSNSFLPGEGDGAVLCPNNIQRLSIV
ncbi:S-type anion channel SLAH4-like [Nicotiana tabacum]|uniref:S-type anion channel SLAH4-like n=1 Tax=Nicotiana tabacum TaxID=4097 RepID=A0A1S4CMJ1_TOBAC|nr:S-type anion channel SLAH4-like [Nicotiana tomentosiformis]XP_016502477.1 PREDICTED: S-type anion channel SLAH4-like [Nicotiana tabacum]